MLDPRTMKAIGRVIGKQAQTLAKQNETTANDVIDLAPLLKPWKNGVYNTGDVVTHNGAPWRCITGHDSTGQANWEPGVAPSLFAPYHATDAEHALPWIAPTGAHDLYRAGEYMVYTDGKTYCCARDTNFSPNDYAQAWLVME